MYTKKCKEKTQLVKRSSKWEDNISVGLKQDGCCFDWINFVQNMGPMALIDVRNNKLNVEQFPYN